MPYLKEEEYTILENITHVLGDYEIPQEEKFKLIDKYFKQGLFTIDEKGECLSYKLEFNFDDILSLFVSKDKCTVIRTNEIGPAVKMTLPYNRDDKETYFRKCLDIIGHYFLPLDRSRRLIIEEWIERKLNDR